MNIIKYPEKLKKGDTIGITAPSCSANLEKLDIAIKNIEKLGFKIVETKSVRNQAKCFVSADGKTRAKEFIELFLDDNIKHIICVRGGEFLIDMIPYLHEYKNKIENLKNIKYVQGYSDISLLNFYLTTNYNIATMHAENINDFWMKNLEKPVLNILDVIKGNYINNEFIQENYKKFQLNEYEEGNYNGYNLTEDVKYKILNKKGSFKVSGRLIGGCIDVITQLLGTKYDNTVNFCNNFNEGMIWYLDNCELSFLEFYRRLTQMKNAGYFENANCFLIGRTFVKESIDGFDMKVALKNALGTLNVPIIYDVDIGHVPPQFVLVNGSYATVEYTNEKTLLTQKFI